MKHYLVSIWDVGGGGYAFPCSVWLFAQETFCRVRALLGRPDVIVAMLLHMSDSFEALCRVRALLGSRDVILRCCGCGLQSKHVCLHSAWHAACTKQSDSAVVWCGYASLAVVFVVRT